MYTKLTSAHEHGTFWENTLTNLRYGFEENFRFNVFSGRLTQLLCLFILGMQLGRQRLFYNEGRHLQIWQTILGCFIFCGYGLACYHRLGITYAVMVGCGMVVCQYLFARFWFSNHQRGPLEGLWRELTWIRHNL